jgi:hypothetical protein
MAQGSRPGTMKFDVTVRYLRLLLVAAPIKSLLSLMSEMTQVPA